MQGMLSLKSHIPTWASVQVMDAFTVLKHPCNCLKCGRFIWALTNYSCNIKTIHTCIYQGRFAVRYRPFPLYTLTCLCTHKAQCAGVCLLMNSQWCWGWSNSWALLAPSEAADIFRMYNTVFWLYNAANAGMCNTGCKSWQAKQFLFGSGYFTVMCLWYNVPFCL